MAFATLCIDVNQIKANVLATRQALPATTKVLLVAKANAYGLGAVPICKALGTAIDHIGLATIDEALELRHHGISTPILLLSEPAITDIPLLSAHNIAATVYTPTTISAIDDYTNKHHVTIETHLKLDTGMTRLGVPWQNSTSVLNRWVSSGNGVIKAGLYSHLANSDAPHALNQAQHQRFKQLTERYPKVTKHLLNSNGITTMPDAHFNGVRIGLSAYQNAFTLQAPIRHIQYAPAGTPVGYDSTYVTPTDCCIATIGMGYADGISTLLSNQGHVVIQQNKAPIVGRICMDMFMVALPKDTSAVPSDTAIICAPDNSNTSAMTLTDMATTTQQNPREVMTRFSHRITREYQ